MPFTRITEGKNTGKYASESGRVYTKKQLRAYYATGGWQRPVLTPEAARKLRQKKRKEKV